MNNNPLLGDFTLPPFSGIKPEHVEPAIDHLLQLNRDGVEQLLNTIEQPDWKNFVEPIEMLDDRLNRAWSPVSHMNSVINSDELRDAYNACLPKLAAYATEMGQNQRLFKAYQLVLESDAALDRAQRKMLQNVVRDFHLSGVGLPPEKKGRFKEISEKLSTLTSKFEQNLLDATNAWTKLITDVEQLAGLPQSALDLAKQQAEQRDLEGWLLTLDFPSYYPVMTYADDRSLRYEVYRAYVTRASDQGVSDVKWDNSAVMEELLALRHEQSQLLDYHNFAERSLAKKMADSTHEVMDFLQDLAHRSRPQAQREYAQLQEFVGSEFGVENLEAWDITYYSEKLRQQRYNITQEELKSYFPEHRVVSGLFEVVHRLFDIHITEKKGVDCWHSDVHFFEIRDADGVLCGQFYLDLYARRNKRGGAWMDECVVRFQSEAMHHTPVAYLTCNFSPPVGDKQALFTHEEVETLFHEFGHGLHHMLTKIDYPGVSGINGVAWDAVELPSQFLENWCWEREALDVISAHYETSEPIPEDLYQRMIAAKNFQSAMQMVRQLEFSIFDFRLYLEYESRDDSNIAPKVGGRIETLINEVRDQVSVIRPPQWNRFANGFSHIFAGGYAAGYYSYKWAEVLSADAFSLFEEQGVFNPQTGGAFKSNILEKGGSEDAMDLFVAFRGRKPQVDSLLRHSGIAASN
ncbi:MAG TPA: oligopeptidase A [Gammaproteobacteria bacterium]|nr:oligopeptidase A [Gammaproteobacteria bacterium]